jgi:type II secretory pathway pseudopilin PulG
LTKLIGNIRKFVNSSIRQHLNSKSGLVGSRQSAVGGGEDRRAMRAERAFSLIEVVVVLGVAGLLVALLGVVVSRAMQSSREAETQQQTEEIFTAIVGNAARSSFGYLGDMGRLPATLSELVAQGSQTAFHTQDGSTAHEGNVGTGWRGPYLTAPFSSSDILNDAWGQPLSYTNTGTSAGQVVSAGPDGTLSTSDDISFPVQLPVLTTGKLVVTVIVNEIPQPAGLTVSVYSTSSGEQGTPVTQTTSSGGAVPFSFTVPHGPNVIKVTHTQGSITVTRTVTVQVPAGTQVAQTVTMRTSATVQM